MRMFDLMLFLALLGAVSGALQYVMLEIQAGIYLVYGVGLFQLITGRQAKGME